MKYRNGAISLHIYGHIYFKYIENDTLMPDKKKPNTDKNVSADLKESKKDQEKLKPDVTIIDLPEVKDIPGQENIRVPDLKEMQDTTISSADEEAEELLADLNREDDDLEKINDSNVTEEEKKLLRRGAGHPRSKENQDLHKMSLDSKDNEGEELNEESFDEDKFGEDLDVPGAELDDENEDRGEEDEENNQYSRPN
jgi:hypothetical protein